MGKSLGFNLLKMRQVGAGIGDIYNAGTNPNQEGGAVTTRGEYSRTRADVDEEAAVAAAMEEAMEDATIPSPAIATGVRKGGLVPPPAVRGQHLYRDNHLQKAIRLLNLNYKLKGGKKTRVHKRIEGWKMHGSKAGDPYPGTLARLIRQGKVFAVLNWRDKHKNLKFPPTSGLMRKYLHTLHELNDYHGAMPQVADVVSGKKRAPGKARPRRGKKSKKGKRCKRAPSNTATVDDELAGTSGLNQEGQGLAGLFLKGLGLL